MDLDLYDKEFQVGSNTEKKQEEIMKKQRVTFIRPKTAKKQTLQRA